MKTKHINFTDSSGRVYCFKHDKLVSLSKDNFMEKECLNCPYFTDILQNTGVECTFDDGCNLTEIIFNDAGDSEYHSKMQYVNLGLKTKREVINSLKSFDDRSNELDSEENSEEENNG